MSRKFLGILLTSALILSGCGATPPAPATTPQETGGTSDVKIAMILNNLGDMGFNDEAFAGLTRAGEELGAQYDYVECPLASDADTQLRMFSDTEEYDLIIVVGADKKDAIEGVAADYPEQRYSLVDSGVAELPNLHGVSAIDPEQTFLSGVIAGLVTQDDRMPLANKENVISFVGGMDSPASRAGAAGFLAGAKYVNREVEIIYTIIGDYRDPGKGKEIALTSFGRGADIVSHNAGASGTGVFSAAEEMGRYVIGSSLATVDPERSLCTSLKKTDLFVFQEVESVISGTWAAGSTKKGIKDGVCDYSLEGVGVQLPEDIIEKVDNIKQMVADGKLVLPNDPNDIDGWLAQNPYQG